MPGIALMAFAGNWTADAVADPDLAVAILVAAAVAGVTVMVRGYRMGVTVTAEKVVVRGLLRSRTVPRDRVVGLTRLPALRWRSASGRLRWTPITAFIDSSQALPFVQQRNDASVRRLRYLLDLGGRSRRRGKRRPRTLDSDLA